MDSPIPPDPYVALGVPKDAKPADIKTAYRKLVLRLHPDKVTDETQKSKAVEEFHRVQQAYEILADEERRSRYDAQVRLAELRRINLELRGGPPGGLRVDTRSTGYETRAPSGSSNFAPRGPTRSYTTDERRPAYYSDDDYPKSAPPRRASEYQSARRSPRESARDRERERERERDHDLKSRKEEERRRAEKSRNVERGYDRSSKYAESRDDDSGREDHRRKMDREETQDSRRPSLRREETNERMDRMRETAEAYISSRATRPSTSRVSSSRDAPTYAYVRPARESKDRRSPPRERERVSASRRGPEIVDYEERRPPNLRKNASDSASFFSRPEKPEVQRSFTSQPAFERSARENDAPPVSLPRSQTMPINRSHQPSRLREYEYATSTEADSVTGGRTTQSPTAASPSTRVKQYVYDHDAGSTKEYRTVTREPISRTSSGSVPKSSSPPREKAGKPAKVASMMANLASSRSNSYVGVAKDLRRPAFASSGSSRDVPRQSRSPERESRGRERLYREIPTDAYTRDVRVEDGPRAEDGSFSKRSVKDDVSYSPGRSRGSRDVYDDGRKPSLGRSSTAVY